MTDECDAARTLARLRDAGLLAPIDFHFGLLAARIAARVEPPQSRSRVAVAAAFLSRAHTDGKAVRLEMERFLADLAARPPSAATPAERAPPDAWSLEGAAHLFKGVAADALMADLLRCSALAAEAPADGGVEPPRKPLLVDTKAKAVYFRLPWTQEQALARGMAMRAAAPPETPAAAVEEVIRAVFPLGEPATPDRQEEAAWMAVRHRLSIVTGGPGTGKTSTAAAALAAIMAQTPGARVVLCAPTGKAAAQLRSSIAEQRRLFHEKGARAELLDALPSKASTIHRLLAWSPARERYMRDAESPVDADVVVVDEASMMPLDQASHLLDAIPPESKIIFLGDKDQLASVESGNVFADLCSAMRGSPNLVELEKSHRFPEDGGIFQMKEAIKSGDSTRAARILKERHRDIHWIDASRLPARDGAAALARVLEEAVKEDGSFLRHREARTPAEAFKEFDSFRILCAARSGPMGVENVNAALAALLFDSGGTARRGAPHGLPVMITRNDYAVRLFNGDIGLIWGERGAPPAHAYFPDHDADAGAGGDGLLRCPLSLLPPHETAFALTIHKAQGSGYGHVLAILPTETESPLLTRELLYTAITRAKRKVTLLCTEAAVRAAVERPTLRPSGLADALRRFQTARPPPGA